MYESCSNRNLFGVVRSRRTARSDTSSSPLLPGSHVRATRRDHRPRWFHATEENYTDRTRGCKTLGCKRRYQDNCVSRTPKAVRPHSIKLFRPSVPPHSAPSSFTLPNSRLANALQAERSEPASRNDATP